jgi:hypothetical protein
MRNLLADTATDTHGPCDSQASCSNGILVCGEVPATSKSTSRARLSQNRILFTISKGWGPSIGRPVCLSNEPRLIWQLVYKRCASPNPSGRTLFQALSRMVSICGAGLGFHRRLGYFPINRSTASHALYSTSEKYLRFLRSAFRVTTFVRFSPTLAFRRLRYCIFCCSVS